MILLDTSTQAVRFPVAADVDRPPHKDPGKPSRWMRVLLDALGLILVVWSIPLAIVVVGTPIVLGVALVVWLARLAVNAF